MSDNNSFSLVFPYESTIIKRRVNILPGAWIDEEEEEEQVQEPFIKTISPLPPQISLVLDSTTAKNEDNNNIELLKQTIDNLRKEKERLEETNDIVKKSIQIVARKRIIAQTHQQQKKRSNSQNEEEEEDIYIIVPNDFIPPTHDEMKAAGLDGWEWISAY